MLKMNKLLGLILLAICLEFLYSASFASTDIKLMGKLILTGSSTVAPLASEIGKRFELLHPGVRIDVQTGGSSRGIVDARQGIASIGMVSRSLKEDEKDLFAFSIANDGICIILHKSNKIKSLTNGQIVKIFSGQIKNWKEIGGTDSPITVVNKAEGRSTLELFLKYFSLKNSQIKAHVVIGDNEQGIKTVAGNPDAIGYVSVGTAEYSSTHNVSIKLLPISGIEASVKNVSNGHFPLSRPLNFVTKAIPKELEKEFIEFARSEKVHDIIRQQYFVPIFK